jgi:hypothetical protein
MLNTLRRTAPLSPMLLRLAATLPLFSAGAAHAHISVDAGGTHMARTSEQKAGPCGAAGAARGANVYTYKPGATITIKVAEEIPHPGYFRISFDNDGDDDFVVPTGTEGTDGDCAGDPKCGEGMGDYCSNDTVLLDNLNQHAGAFTTHTWSVKLPDVECDNCTLQIIQMMNDLNVHRTPYPADDIYYQCIDIVLKADAPDVTDTPVMNMGMDCKANGAGSAGAAAAAGAGGAAAGAAGEPAAGTAGEGGEAAGAGGSDAAEPEAETPSTAAPSAGAAGTKAPAAAAGSGAASPTTPAAAGGKAPASGGTGAQAAAGSSSGSTTSGVDSGGGGPAASESGGCQAVGGSSGLLTPALLSLLTLGFRRFRRRGNAS